MNETIKRDDAIFNAAMSVLGEWPATRECSMRARMTMAADLQDRIMDTVQAMLDAKKRSAGGKNAAAKRWEKQKAKAITAAAEMSGVTAEMRGAPPPVADAPKKRGRPAKAAPPPPPPLATEPPSDVKVERISEAIPPLPPMPSAVPASAAPSANPFGTTS
jgi:hypothetical protein